MTKASRQTAVVTGASGLIGSAVCEQLASAGVDVIAIDVTPTDIVTPGVEFVQADVASMDAVRAAVETIRKSRRCVDWLVHAAALTGSSSPVDLSGPVSTVDLHVWQRTLDVNLTGSLICVQLLLPLLKQSTDGRVILVGSIQGLVPTFESGSYAVSKAAMVGLTRQLAAEMAKDAITVNLVCPGTTIQRRSDARPGWPNPMGRFGGADELSRAIAGLLLHGSAFMTGAIIPVDGGEHLRPRNSPTRPN